MSGSVNIPIGANATAAVAAFDQLRDAIQRTGQAGKSFEQLDLSHPELSGFAADLAIVRQQLDDLTRVGRGETASAARRLDAMDAGNGVRQENWNPAAAQERREANWERLYPDPVERSRVRERYEAHVNRGTQFAPQGGGGSDAPPAPAPGPAPGPAPRPPRPPGSPDESEGGGLLSSGLGLLKTGGGIMLGLAGVQGLASMVGSAVSGASEESSSTDQLMRRLPDLNHDFESLRDGMREATEGMGLTYQAGLQLAQNWQKLGTRDHMEGTQDAVQYAAMLGRSYGIAPEVVQQAMGHAVVARVSKAEFAQNVGEVSSQGKLAGQIEEVLSALTKYTDTSNRRMVGDLGQAGMVKAFGAMFAGMTGSGSPGFTAANAEGLINRIDQSIMQGGHGGLASTALNYRAFGRAGVTDPYKMSYLQEGGMFQDAGNGQNLWQVQKAEIDRQYKGRPAMERLYAYRQHTGMTMHEAEGMDRIKDVDMNRTQKYLTEHHILNNSVGSFVDIANVLNGGDLEGSRSAILKRKDLTAPERSGIEGASGEDLKLKIVQALAEHGTIKTQAQETQDSTTKMVNASTALGEHLLDPLNAIRDLLGKIGAGMEFFVRQFTPRAGQAAPVPNEGGTPGLQGTSDGAPILMPVGFHPGAGMTRRGFGGGSGYGGGGGASAALPAGEAQGRTQEAFDYFKQQGWTDEQAAGITANLFKESGMRTDANGDGGQSGGYGQWNHERRAMFRKRYNHDVREGTRAEQLDFVQWELTHTHKAAGDRLRSTRTGYDAGAAVSDSYEIPADRFGEMAGRGNLTERMLPGLRDHAGRGRGGAGDDVGGARVIHTIAPLRVIHEDSRGNRIRERSLPIQSVLEPSPYGYDANPLVEHRNSPAPWYPSQPRPTTRPPDRPRELRA